MPRRKRKKPIKRICKNCRLYDPGMGHCSVVVLHEGRRLHMPVLPNDLCLFEDQYFDPNTEEIDDFTEDIKEVKFWVENDKGDKTAGNGVVKMEYPEGFLGDGA